MRNISIFVAVTAVVVIGCSEHSFPPEIEVSANTVDTLPQEMGSFKIAVPMPKIVATNVARVEYVITASDMSDLKGSLAIGNDDVARGTARNVPTGNDRLVTLNAYNTEEVMSYSGSATTDVVAGETVSVNIVMRSLLPATGDIEINGTFITVDQLLLYSPFADSYPIMNYFDHEYPNQTRNGTILTWWGERSTTIGYDGHPGTDWPLPEGTPVLAAARGWIRKAGWETEEKCWGSPPCPTGQVPCETNVQRVILDTRFDGRDGAWEGYLVAYYHLSRIDVAEDQVVEVGDQIGLSGDTGCASSPHLHLQVLWSDANGDWASVDPYGWQGSVAIPADPWAEESDGAVSHYLWMDAP